MVRGRIVCIGNRHAAGDDLGPRTFDWLAARPLPVGIELVDGGLGGLDLLACFEGVGEVVVVDALEGFAPPGCAVVLDGAEVAACHDGQGWGHGAGLPYLLALLPRVCDGPLPRIRVVGMEPPAGDGAVARLGAASLALAAGEEVRP
jgi:hydrogenase maturation protease